MASFFQMGYNTENLVGEADLELFKGIILSPLNRNPLELDKHIKRFRKLGDYEIVFDPQLYFPRASKGLLKNHSYFPSDFETADSASFSWWNKLNSNLVPYINVLGVDSVCSPIVHAKSWKEDYYKLSVEIKDNLMNALKKINPMIKCLLTIVINVKDLTDEEKIMKTASIASATQSDGFYIVFINELAPRYEIRDKEDLKGMVRFIAELKHFDIPIIVSHTSSDMILFKYVGADHCATGKYFNLRRFSQSRFNDIDKGGNQLPYWFEPNLLGFLREADVLRLSRDVPYLIKDAKFNNIWSAAILNNFNLLEQESWIKFGWRQYLSIYSKLENVIDKEPDQAINLLSKAQSNWELLNKQNIFMEEKTNDGSWIDSWLTTLMNLKNDSTY